MSEQSSLQRFKRLPAVQVRTIAVVTGLLIAAVAFAAFVAFKHFALEIRREATNSLQVLADAKREQIEGLLAERMSDATFIAGIEPVWRLLDPDTDPQQREEFRRQYMAFATNLEQNHPYELVRLRDVELRPAGGRIAYALSPVEMDGMRAAMTARQPRFIPAHLDQDGRARFGIAHPVFAGGKQNGTVTGVAYLDISIEDQLLRVIANWPADSRSSETLIVTQDRDDAVYVTPLRHLPAARPLTERRPMTQPNFLAARALRGERSTGGNDVDYRGVRILAGTAPVTGTDWYLIAKVDVEEVDEPVRAFAAGILGISIFAVLLLLASAALLWRALQAKAVLARVALDLRYRTASQTSIDGYLLIDTAGRIVESNQSATGITGYAKEELLRLTITDLDTAEAGETITGKFAGVRDAGSGRFYARWRTKTGNAVELAISASYLPQDGSGIFHVFIRDIGEELRATRQLERLNRYYAFLNHANTAIFELTSPATILNRVCEHAVNDGGFVLAWAGLLDEAAGRLAIVAAHGAAADYARQLVITTDPALPTSHGPTRTSMVERKTQYVENFHDDPRTKPWHEIAARYGIKSSVVAPIVVEGIAVGALNFYVDDTGYFDPEIRALIDETGRTLSVAFQMLAARRARDVSEARFEQVFAGSPVPMQLFERQTRKARAINAAHLRTFGYELADIPDEAAWMRSVYPDQAQRDAIATVWEADVQAALTRDPGNVQSSAELELRCKDGSFKTVRGQMSVVGDDIVVQWIDLTDIKRVQQELAENERRFRGLIEQTITGVYVVQDGKIVYANPRVCGILGLAAEDLVGRNVLEVLGLDSAGRQAVLDGRAQLNAGKRSVAVNLPVMRQDGGRLLLGTHAAFGTWRGLPATVVMAQDVTERQRAEQQIAAYVKQLEATMRDTLMAVSNMVELRDPYTAGHEKRVGIIAADIAREMGWDEARCESLQLIGLVHDIGKIGVPAEILSKPSRLTALEFDMVKEHARLGYEILRNVRFPLPIADIIHEHHERMDGSGYPQGLKGNAICIEARILAVADVVESMASHRPYRPALGLDAAIKEIESHRETAFDATVVDALLRLIREKGYRLPV